jgi:cytochrome c2
MSSTYKKFVNLLTVELESLRDELEVLVKYQDTRLEKQEITDYVRHYNVATLQNQVKGLQEFLRCEGCLDADSDASLEEIADEIRGYVKAYFDHYKYVPATYELVKLRIDKITNYLKDPASRSFAPT